ncbi:hypothetical protein QR680_008042 [Steinernema hermaphroditum]|uniref:UBX domain-containing protein n=1 Tax=Steinernema hermaphroditum TaxID=289476 RepID=A0AA39IF40_9BILA|nr:hypothetical protein QR680_008042 [Steinernema hermaphroditum]
MSDYSDYEFNNDSDYCDFEEEMDCLPGPVDSGLPLIMEGLDSMRDIVENYEAVFERRFGKPMRFFRGSLREANNVAFKAAGINKKPLALYIHKDGNKCSNDFPSKVLTNKAVADIVKSQFVLWGWDISSVLHKAQLEELMAEASMRRIFREIEEMNESEFPKLVIVTAPKWVHRIDAVVNGDYSVDSTKTVLLNSLEAFVDERSASPNPVFTSERDYLLQEQQKEYERALAEDRAKEEEKRKKEEEERKRIEEEERLERERVEEERRKVEEAERKRQTLPEEPSLSESNVIALRLRLPGGDQLNRRFRYTEKIGFVSVLVESLGFPISTFDVFNSDRPRKNLAVFDQEASFEALKWPKREIIIVEEKFD